MVAAHYVENTSIWVYIIYKPGSILYIMDWLSRNNHAKNKVQGITGMNINVTAISASIKMSVYTSIEDIQVATQENTHLHKLKSYVIQGWPHNKDELEQSIFSILETDTTAVKHQPNGYRKMTLKTCELVYWLNMNANIKKYCETVYCLHGILANTIT